MPAAFRIARSEVNLDATYPAPQFALFGGAGAGLLPRLFARLSPHGLKLSDMKIERGSGPATALGDVLLSFYLLDFALTVRVRLDRVELYCPFLTVENSKRVTAATIDTLDCLRPSIGGQYHAYNLSLGLHGLLENQSGRAFLSKLIAAPPNELGPTTGNAVGYYLPPSDARIASSITFDVSLVAADGLFARPQASWDASRLPLEQLDERAREFVMRTLGSFGIEIPSNP